MSREGGGAGAGAGKISAGNPYAVLPAASTKPAEDPKVGVKRKAGGLPDGWKKVPSQSNPGKFSYQNIYTMEKIGWVPDRPASRRRKELPPVPKVEKKKPRPVLSDEEKQAKDCTTVKLVLEKLLKLIEAQDDTGTSFLRAMTNMHKAFFCGGKNPVSFLPDMVVHVFPVLRATQTDPGRLISDANRKAVMAVFKVIREKLTAFPPEQHYQLNTWIMRSVTHNNFFTDDTYQFNASSRVFTDALAEMEQNSKKQIIELAGMTADGDAKVEIAPELVAERKDVMIEVLMTLVAKAKLPWAVSTVKAYFKAVVDRRPLFNEEQKEKMNEANDRLTKREVAAAGRAVDKTGMMQGRIIPRQSKFG